MSLMVAVIAAGFTGIAYASANGPAADIPAEVWLGLLSTVIFSLLAGYTRGLEKRLTLLEHEDRQQWAAIGLIRETVLREHPSRHETDQHRAYVEGQLQHIRERLDFISRPHHRHEDDR